MAEQPSVWLIEREFFFDKKCIPVEMLPSATKAEAEKKWKALENWPLYRVAEYRRVEVDK